MNNEIKEILDRIETASEIFDCLLKPEECTKLLDYMTNLQQEIEKLNDDKRGMLVQLYKENNIKDKTKQENERLQENNQAMQEEMARTWQKCNDYKSRCEKALDKLKRDYLISFYSDCNDNIINKVIEILQNGVDTK